MKKKSGMPTSGKGWKIEGRQLKCKNLDAVLDFCGWEGDLYNMNLEGALSKLTSKPTSEKKADEVVKK